MTILQRPDPLSLSLNLKDFHIATTEQVSLVLRQNDTEIIAQRYTPPASGRITISLKDVIHDRLSFLLTETDTAYEQPSLVGDFTAFINDTPYTFRVIRSGVDRLADAPENFLRQNWLTWQPTTKAVTYHCPEFLTYYAVDDCRVCLQAHFLDEQGVEEEFTQSLTLATLSAGKAYTIPLQYGLIAGKLSKPTPGYYDVWVEDMQGHRLSYTQRYVASDLLSEQEQWILFENSLGGIDTFRAYGTTSLKGEHSHAIAELDELSREYRVDTHRTYTQNTGFLDAYQRRWLLDFFPSLGKYIYQGNHLRRIVLTESDVTYTNRETLSSYSFSYRLAEQLPLLNLPRTSIPLELLQIKLPSLESFTIPPRLVEVPRLPLSEGALLPIQHPYAQSWGTTTPAALATYIIRRLEAMASTANGGVGHGHANIDLLDALSILQGYLLHNGEKIKAGHADLATDLATKKYISSNEPDTAAGHITFKDGLTATQIANLLKGFQTGGYLEGVNGRGAKLDKDGHAELDSLFVRQFLETPELRYNRIAITQGEQWCARGGGIIEVVDTDARLFRLKLEAGELPTVAVDDLCKGIFNTSTGFSTCFFRVMGITPDGWVTYELRPGYTAHPTPAMHFVAYGNLTDISRQQSAYSTTGYTRYLRGVNDWEIMVDNIAMQLGDLSNLTAYGLQLEGYSAYLSNVYFTGILAQLGQAVAERMPRINATTGTWMQWDEQAAQMVDSGVKAKGEQGAPGADGRPGIDWGAGKMLYRDPTFVDGDNGVRPYNNASNGMLHMERVASEQGCPTSSTHMLRVSVRGTTTPGFGGIYFGGVPKHNHIYLVRLLAKVPVGYSLRNPGTRVGNGGRHDWLTPTAGTGGWQEYIYKLTMGDSGVLDSSFYIFLMGGGATPTAAAPLVWEVAYATVYDATDSDSNPSAIAQAQSLATYQTQIATERQLMEESYKAVYTHPLLMGATKTALLNTKTSYQGAAETLINALNAAIAGGVTTATQKAEVDRRTGEYKTAITDFRKATEAAQREVQDLQAQETKLLGKGKMLYTDPAFAGGRNQTYPYGSLDTNLLLLERVPTGEGNPYPSTHMLRITSKGQCAPGWGGFYFATPTRANQILITRIVAKIPVGRSIAFGTNALTPGHTHRWLTPTAGTGGWQEYIYYVQQGTGGSYHKTNYFYLTGGATPTPAAPLVWHVAYATVYDATDVGPDYMAEITAKAGELKTYVDGAFADGMIDAAEARAIAKYINIVDTERATLEANYTKLYTNPRLTGVAKTTLLNTKVSWEGKVTALLSAIRTAIADGKTTAAEKADVDAKYGAYRADTANLHKALQDANKAVAVAEAVPKVEVIVDASALDPNKYYPVTIGRLLQNKAQTIRVWRDLNTTLYNVPSWSTHARGCTVYLEWMTNGSDWGVRSVDRRIITWQSIFAADNKPPVGDIGQITQGSMEHCYVRGGSHYSVSIEGTTDAAITLHPQGYEWVSGTYRIPLPVRDYVSAPRVTAATKDDIPPTYLLPMPHDPTVTYVGGSTYAAVVYDAAGLWYKAIKDVPVGINLTNRNYWQPISSMGAVGIGEAYIRSLWANKAFVKELHAQSIMARSIKAGDNPDNPQALIDEHGYGHLSGGALRFDAGGLHMGAFDITDGNIVIKDEQGEDRVAYSLGKIPALTDISSRGKFSGTTALAGWWMTASQFWNQGKYDDRNHEYVCTVRGWSTGKVSVGKDGADLRIGSKLSASSPILTGGLIQIKLSPDKQNFIGSGYSNPSNFTEFEDISFGDCIIRNLPKGDYYVYVEISVNFIAESVPTTRQFHVSFPIMSWSLDAANFRKIAYHPDGWYISYPDLLVYMSGQDGLHITGNTNLPGVLCAARIDARRNASYSWGKFVLIDDWTTVKVDRDSQSGIYKVYHSIDHENYIPTVTPQGGEPLIVSMLDTKANYFTFKLYNRNGGIASSAFNYQCVGSNSK